MLSIDCEWADPVGGPREVAETSATIDIQLDDRHITRAENDFSKTVTTRPLLSAYPLALWLAGSWWRLRWEASPNHAKSNDWRMSHELAAAGAGFVWPGVVFETDGESIHLSVRPSSPSSFEPLRYLEDTGGWIPARDFEGAVGAFLDLVVARLDDRGLRRTELHSVWNEVSIERADPELARFRQIEAILGFDAGSAADDLVLRFEGLRQQAGVQATEEIAHAAAGPRAEQVFSQIVNVARAPSVVGKFQVRSTSEIKSLRNEHPWRRGYALAQHIRSACNLDMPVLQDDALAGLLGLKEEVLHDAGTLGAVPAGVVVRGEHGAHFHFRRRSANSRRFEAARMLADQLLAPDADSWLLETDAHTARQKAQRAFAAEFLCPMAALGDYLDGDLSDTLIEEAAEHFRVSERIVQHQVANSGRPGSGLISI